MCSLCVLQQRVREISLNIEDYLQGGGVNLQYQKKGASSPSTTTKMLAAFFPARVRMWKFNQKSWQQSERGLRRSLAQTTLQSRLSCEVSPC